MPFGLQIFPGQPSDPSQPEQPSVLELLGTLAANIYSQDPRYSAAAGLGQGFADIFGGMRKTRQETQQAQILKGLYPDLPLDKFRASGMKFDLGDLASMQQANEKKSALAELTKALETPQQQPTQVPGAAGGVSPVAAPQMSLGQWLKAQEAGIRLPESVLKAQGGNEPKSPWQAELLAAGGDVNKALSADTLRQQQIAGGKAGVEESARQQARSKAQGSGPTLSRANSIPSILYEWGLDPKGMQPGDPRIGEAREALTMQATRAKRAKESADIYTSASKALELLPRVVAKAEELKGKYGDFMLGQYADTYEAIQTGEPGLAGKIGRAPGQIYGIPTELKQYFNLVGSLRNSLMKAYAAQIPSRAASFIKGTQIHVPAMRSSLKDVSENARQVQENLIQAKRFADPNGDPERERKIRTAMERFGFNRSYAEYRIDKLEGLAGGPSPAESAEQAAPEAGTE